jgi:MoxR-like ATPase
MGFVMTDYTFANLFKSIISNYGQSRNQPFQTVPPLKDAFETLKKEMSDLNAVNDRHNIIIKWSVGNGGWADVPWVALLNKNWTTSTQNGVYIAFLIAKDLSVIYLCLMQGMTDLVKELGQRKAAETMVQRSQSFYDSIGFLKTSGFELSNKISLNTTGWRSKNYEIGTIAHIALDPNNFPNDVMFGTILDDALRAYDILASVDENGISHSPNISTEQDQSYSIDDALSNIFMDKSEFEKILDIWRIKKNIILQGVPGVGKSFIAKRLSLALTKGLSSQRMENIQFHQSYSYEDFVQGYRPNNLGGFALTDGIFTRFCNAAIGDPANVYVLIIDEINRGNLSKIFGELMLLMESDKRNANWGVRLAYSASNDNKFHIPANLYIIGLMNTADRSLAMVDYALRRRFAFINLRPQFHNPEFRAVLINSNVPENIVNHIISSMTEINNQISNDTINLGPGFCIGHSYFVPGDEDAYYDGWFQRVVETEIVPLLEEYWFDDPSKVEFWIKQLQEMPQ